MRSRPVAAVREQGAVVWCLAMSGGRGLLRIVGACKRGMIVFCADVVSFDDKRVHDQASKSCHCGFVSQSEYRPAIILFAWLAMPGSEQRRTSPFLGCFELVCFLGRKSS